MRRIRFIVYKWVRRVVRLNDTPHSVAAGASIGIFVGMLPLYGFQMIIAASVAAVSRVNKVAAIVPVWITNPATIPPFLYLQYLLGKLVVRGREVEGVWPKIERVGEAAGNISLFDFEASVRAFLVASRNLGWEVFWPTMIGSIISGVFLGLITYPLALRAVIWYRTRKELRRARRRQRLADYLSGASAETGSPDEAGTRRLDPPSPGP